MGTSLSQTAVPELVATLTPILELRASIKEQIAIFAEQEDVLNDAIKGEMARAGVRKIEAAGYSVTFNPEATRDTLDKLRLVELGVGTDVIAKATKTSTYMKLDVRKKGKE